MKKFFAYFAVIVLACLFGLFVRQYVAGVTSVAGDSMADTLVTGDKVLVYRLGYALDGPERGDIAQIELAERGGLYLKRVIGLPGDRVEIVSGQVYINGQPIAEPYAKPDSGDYFIELADDEYFVLGDNRPVSYDSREEDFGVISASSFRGKVCAILWPADRISFDIE